MKRRSQSNQVTLVLESYGYSRPGYKQTIASAGALSHCRSINPERSRTWYGVNPAISRVSSWRENDFTMSFSHILVPVEFSERCIGAAGFAVGFARRFEAKVTLLHVELPEGDPFWVNQHAHELEKQLAAFLPGSWSDLKVQRIVHINPDVAGAILLLATQSAADLIVMPTHGYGALRRTLLGSVTARVLREAPCPVWTSAHMVPAPPAEWLDPERIVCAVCGAPESGRVLTWAASLASELNTQLCIVRIVSQAERRGHGRDSQAESLNAIEDAQEEIDRFGQTYPIKAKIAVETGAVPDALKKSVAGLRASLLVIGRDSRIALEDAGPNTYEIIRAAPCPVISV